MTHYALLHKKGHDMYDISVMVRVRDIQFHYRPPYNAKGDYSYSFDYEVDDIFYDIVQVATIDDNRIALNTEAHTISEGEKWETAADLNGWTTFSYGPLDKDFETKEAAMQALKDWVKMVAKTRAYTTISDCLLRER